VTFVLVNRLCKKNSIEVVLKLLGSDNDDHDSVDGNEGSDSGIVISEVDGSGAKNPVRGMTTGAIGKSTDNEN
jgi:hypothetical protein